MESSIDRGPPSGPFGREDPGLPQVFGRYLLVQRLSRGGMGEIFLAKHGLAGFEKLAVIKKVLPHLAADEQFISRFVDEAQVAIKLQHVNVAQVFEVGRVGDEYFLALEYVEGRDLRRTLALLAHRRERMPVDLALFVARELANGLAYAHRRTTSDGASLHLVHCDISPPNVLVSFEGETKVIDFGIAKSAMRGTATDPKIGFGKFGYMAPEQLIRGGVVDHRTDLYAAGVVLFELLTGTRLYEAGPEPDYRALARKVTRGQHALPSEIDPSLAPYDDLVVTALRPRPEDRYQSAAELRDAIQQCLVAVNPTISTDQLGTYMRELFADEMTAQRELHERVASAHLSDFEEQFHTQTISTISYALAQIPEPGRAGRRASSQMPAAEPRRSRTTGQSAVATRSTGPNAARTTGPSPVARSGSGPAVRGTGPNPVAARTPASGPVATRSSRSNPAIALRNTGSGPAAAWPNARVPTAPLTGEVDPVEPAAAGALDGALDGAFEPAADGPIEGIAAQLEPGDTIAMPEQGLGPAPRRRGLMIAVGAAGALLAVVLVWGLSRTDGATGQARATVPPLPARAIVVEPIPPVRPAAPPAQRAAAVADPPGERAADHASEPAGDPEIEMTNDDAPPSHAPPRKVAVRSGPRPPAPVAPAAPTREQLAQKFQQIGRQYSQYKTRFGSRLEREWGELATFVQYKLASNDDASRKEAARALDEFRDRMRE
ncbi:MAG TPA: protein kinase [Kofleriaceae bacterium]|nr:protein kinase [Kofleriaceae bacterium]